MSYLLIGIAFILVFNIVLAYSLSRWKKDYYFYPVGAADQFYKTKRFMPTWKDGDVKTMNEWYWPHIIVTVIAAGWPVTIPLTLFLVIFGAVLFGVYKAVLWAATLGRDHVDKSSRSDTEV